MVNIYGGTIYTDYGIGSAYKSAGGVVRIYGANVRTDAIGCSSQAAYYHAGYIVAYLLSLLFASDHGGAAIGGDSGNSGIINITDSEITAIGGEYTAGIGGGDEGGCDSITITNSKVDATGDKRVFQAESGR